MFTTRRFGVFCIRNSWRSFCIQNRQNELKIDENSRLSDRKINAILQQSATKFRLDNIPTTLNVTQLSKMLSSNGIKFKKVVKIFAKPFAKIHFYSNDQARDMLRRISTFSINDKKIYINTNAARVSFEHRISDKRVEDITTPWWDIPYEEQLIKKQSEGEEILSNVTKEIIDAYKDSGIEWVDKLCQKSKKLDKYPPVCNLHEIIPSPKQVGYRNKISFSIGWDKNDVVTIGFVMGKFKEGIIHLASPVGAVNSPVHPTAMNLRQLFEDYIRNESKLPVFNRVTNEGFWRGVEIKTFNSGENSVLFQVKTSSATQDEIEDEIGRLVQIIVLREEFKKSTSIFLQEWNTTSGAPPLDAKTTLLYNKEFVHETLRIGDLNPLTFRVRPTTFFQTNSYACEKLYSKVVDLCKEFVSDDEHLTILDICCGTGTIGLAVGSSLPKSKVLGIDIVESAIQDAYENSVENKITSTEYLVGDVRQYIDRLTNDIDGKCIAIVDPPRAGLHKNVRDHIIFCENIDRLIYIACNPKTLEECMPSLCSVFKPVSSYIVDLFPQTSQMEMIVCFDRIQKKE